MTIADLFADLASAPRLDGALCRSRPRIFDAETEDDTAQAITICARCPDLAACTTWANSLPANALTGVVAGHVHNALTGVVAGHVHEPEPTQPDAYLCGRPTSKQRPCRNQVDIAGQPCEFHSDDSTKGDR